MSSVYNVLWQDEALKDLLRLPRKEAAAIVKKVDNYLAQNPQKIGKALTGDFSGLYRFRYGDYRIIYEIHQQTLRIYVIIISL